MSAGNGRAGPSSGGSTKVAASLCVPAGRVTTNPIPGVTVELDSRRAGLEALEGEKSAAAPGFVCLHEVQAQQIWLTVLHTLFWTELR